MPFITFNYFSALALFHTASGRSPHCGVSAIFPIDSEHNVENTNVIANEPSTLLLSTCRVLRDLVFAEQLDPINILLHTEALLSASLIQQG
jgi:hypothetical protein